MSERTAEIQTYELPTRNGGVHSFTGTLLGSGSSESPEKDRWFEVEIYRDARTGSFILHTAGQSRIDGEVPLYRMIITPSALEVADRLIVHHDRRVYVPNQSLRALTAASQWDDDMLEALRELPTMIAARQAGVPRSA